MLDWLIVFFATDLPYVLIVALLFFVLTSAYSNRIKVNLFVCAILSGIIAKLGVTELIRLVYERPRPFTVLPINELLTSSAWSFPSGHAAFFFALATVVYLYNKKWGVGFFISAILVSLARITSGVHYPSDILGGALVGIGVAFLVIYFIRKRTEPSTTSLGSTSNCTTPLT